MREILKVISSNTPSHCTTVGWMKERQRDRWKKPEGKAELVRQGGESKPSFEGRPPLANCYDVSCADVARRSHRGSSEVDWRVNYYKSRANAFVGAKRRADRRG